MSPTELPLFLGVQAPTQYMVSWSHLSPHPIQRLSQFSCFVRLTSVTKSETADCVQCMLVILGPDLQNILRQSFSSAKVTMDL